MYERANFLTWAIASILGSAAGIFLMNLGQSFAAPERFAWLSAALVMIPAMLTATFQWAFCLRSRINALAWILVSTFGRLGFAVLWFWLWFFFERPTTPYGAGWIDIELYGLWGVTAAVAGAMLGVCQWLVLRRVYHGAKWWISATAIGAVIAWCYKLAVIQFALEETLEYAELVANSHGLPALAQGLLLGRILRLKVSAQDADAR